MHRCLYCYKELKEGQADFHPACSRKMFGTTTPPTLPYTRENIAELAEQVIRSQSAVTGVQPKLSLDLQKVDKSTARFTIVGLWGRYILKPQTELFPCLPELEDLTMHLAEIAKIRTVPHSLIRFADGELCYITRRIDRTDAGSKLPMEDMCQLTERLTEYKYKGSYEQIAKAIVKFSSVPKLDLVNFWEQVYFCWLTGNADMHLKNFSLYSPEPGLYMLTPAYDMLSTALVMPEDKEELALPLNDKKARFPRRDFENAMITSGVDSKVADNILSKFARFFPKWEETIRTSFLDTEMQERYLAIIHGKLG